MILPLHDIMSWVCPFINAGAAFVYIILVAVVMFFGVAHTKGPDTIVVPIAILSLVSLSTAVMAYIFLYQPVQLYLDGKKKEATSLVTKTLLTFAGITAVIFTLYLTRVLH
jgi:hypothetical protein